VNLKEREEVARIKCVLFRTFVKSTVKITAVGILSISTLFGVAGIPLISLFNPYNAVGIQIKFLVNFAPLTKKNERK
tara:strand:+ start:113 stop:343 length:231 start_codon:yes stop_codon:yes gene_type:complete